MDRPTNNQKCGNERCGHGFGMHYETYDGNRTGCSFYLDDQRDGGPCFCKGFALVQRWGAKRERTTPENEQMYR
jgi:hypothetical protein